MECRSGNGGDDMKKFLLFLCVAAFALTSCGGPTAVQQDAFSYPADRELTVFAASSLRDTLEEIARRYEEATPWVRLRFQFAGSGDLMTQIREGASCDLFISASPTYMDALNGALFIDPERNAPARVDLLENQLVLAVPDRNPKEIRNFAHMAALLRQEPLLLSLGGGETALGEYTSRIFEYYYLNESALSRNLTYATSAEEAVTRLRNGMADGAILYRTDADALNVVDTADASMCGRLIYCAGVLSQSRYPLAASGFLEYLTGAEASDVFSRAGFLALSREEETVDEPDWSDWS